MGPVRRGGEVSRVEEVRQSRTPCGGTGGPDHVGGVRVSRADGENRDRGTASVITYTDYRRRSGGTSPVPTYVPETGDPRRS